MIFVFIRILTFFSCINVIFPNGTPKVFKVMFSIFISFIILIYALLSFIFDWNNITPGWTSIMVAITFFAGVQLLSLWMMSEYIGRIYDESKERPQYIIDKTINIE